ncbi:MAG: hypothetical protein WC711_00660 [Candidatus Staskawiczbacteria bacterium]|jgi:hypothetical protein
MKQKNILLILLPLLFLGLFLCIDKISASYVNQGDYYDNDPNNDIDAYAYPTSHNYEYSSWSFDSLPDGMYPHMYGSCSNSACKDWYEAFNGSAIDEWLTSGGSIPWDEKLWKNYNITVRGSTNYNYYGPGYYMFRIEYPEETYDSALGAYNNYGNVYFYDYRHWDSFNSSYYGYVKNANVPVLLTGTGYSDQTVSLRMTWSFGWNVQSYDGFYPNSYIPFNVYYTPIAHNGVCGDLNGTFTESTRPNQGIACLSWPYVTTVEFATVDNPTTTWTCEGTLGGADQGCAMKIKVDGVCNSSTNGHQLSIQPSGDELCSKGAPTMVAGDGSLQRPWQWGCLGINGGTSTSITACSATIKKDGKCGTFTNGGSFLSAPSGNNNLCDYGTATAVTGTGAVGNPWTWKCNSPDGGAQSLTCTANASGTSVDGVCGPAATTYNPGVTSFSGNLCTIGIASPTPSFPTASDPIKTWTCSNGSGNNSPTCTAVLTVDGVCGPAAKAYPLDDLSFPDGDYCSSGTMLTDSQTYYYRVSAINSVNPGPASAVKSISTP